MNKLIIISICICIVMLLSLALLNPNHPVTVKSSVVPLPKYEEEQEKRIAIRAVRHVDPIIMRCKLTPTE